MTPPIPRNFVRPLKLNALAIPIIGSFQNSMAVCAREPERSDTSDSARSSPINEAVRHDDRESGQVNV